MVDTDSRHVVPADHRCGTCHRGPDEVEFEWRGDRDIPRPDCRGCRNEKRNIERREARAARRELPVEDGSVEKMVSITMRRSTKLPALRLLAGAMLERFGDVDGLADVTFHHIDKILKDKPGTKSAIDALRFVYKLIESGLQEEKVQLDFSTMTEAELQASVVRYFQRQGLLPRNGNGHADGTD